MKGKLRVYSRVIYFDCPHCEEELEGWYFDPRGSTDVCNNCNNVVEIPKDAEIELIG